MNGVCRSAILVSLLWFGGSDQTAFAFASNAIVADPLFAAHSAVTFDFTLEENSPAVSTGDISVLNLVKSNYDLPSTSARAESINRESF